MTIKTWQQLMGLKETNPPRNWGKRIERVLKREQLFAPNMTIFMDQNLISWKIYKWFQEHDKCNCFLIKFPKIKVEI